MDGRQVRPGGWQARASGKRGKNAFFAKGPERVSSFSAACGCVIPTVVGVCMCARARVCEIV